MATRGITMSEQYTGRLAGRLTGQRLTSGSARVTKISLGKMDNNAYIVESLPGGQALLIDAADDAEALIDYLRSAAPGLTMVVTTHNHRDHWQALAETVSGCELITAAGEVDSAGIPVTTDRMLQHGDTLSIGSLSIDIIGLRGHTQEGIALALTTAQQTHLFTGDSLFPGGPGKTSSPEKFNSLITDLEQRIFRCFDDDTIVHPGHGDDTTIGQERPQLPAWKERGW